MAIVLVLLVIVLLLLAVAVARLVFSDVPGPRVERFARREGLRITPANRPAVIGYLAVTRRWRTFGLLVTVAASMVWNFRDSQSLYIGLFPALSGWFAGAVVAEWRLARREPGRPRRSASLTPRLLTDYVGGGLRFVPAVVAGANLLMAAVLLVLVTTGDGTEPAWPLLWSLATVVLFAGPALVARYVLTRARPGELAPDQLAADEAMRRRSLHALIGSSIALLAVPSGSLLGLLLDALLGENGLGFVAVALSLVLLVVGFVLAVGPRNRPVAPVSPVGASVA